MTDYDLLLNVRVRRGWTRGEAALAIGAAPIDVKEIETCSGAAVLSERQRLVLQEELAATADAGSRKPKGMRFGTYRCLKWRWENGLSRQDASERLGMDLLHYADGEMNGSIKLWRYPGARAITSSPPGRP